MIQSSVFRRILYIFVVCSSALAQQDPLQHGAMALKKHTRQRLSLTLEERTRWEERFGNSFGKSPSQQYMVSRLRIGANYAPSSWLQLSSTAQDARAPWYDPSAPNTLRDSIDLQEGYAVLGSEKQGLNFSAGRRMINYGETRVIGVPQWTNASRTYDYGRLRYANKRVMADAVMVSPVIILSDQFNKPELGNRYWGGYFVLPELWHHTSVDVYALRHSQNKIGGWQGAGTLGSNNYGARFYGRLPGDFKYSLEGIGQNGHSGALDQRAYAWFAGGSRQVKLASMPIDLSAEYKVASGSHAGEKHSATFDQLTPSNHDKFGHMDLFGWKNLKSFKTLEVAHLTPALDFNLMYTRHNLFNAADALYASSGTKIVISSQGTAGRYVGQEVDGYATYKWGAHTFYAGVGHFFKGSYVERTTPGINPRYFYLAQQYTIK